MMTASAIAAYNSSDGQKTKAWMEANLPLFKEAEKLNPYYHGFGPGGFGGINKTPYSVAEQFLYGGKSGSLDSRPAQRGAARPSPGPSPAATRTMLHPVHSPEQTQSQTLTQTQTQTQTQRQSQSQTQSQSQSQSQQHRRTSCVGWWRRCCC